MPDLFIAFESDKPSSESLQCIHKAASMLAPDAEHLCDWHTNYARNHGTRLAFDLDVLKDRVQTGSNVLELGSIPLVFTLAAAFSGYVITGCDINPARYAGAILKNKLTVAKCNIETDPLPFKNDSFDAIVFNELFEHLRINPIFTLRETLRVLRPGGVLMLSSPNLRSVNGLINFLLWNRAHSCFADPYSEYQKLETLGHMGHVREYTTTEVTEFLEKIGFAITRLVYRGTYPTAGRRLLARVAPKLRPFVSYIATKRAPGS